MTFLQRARGAAAEEYGRRRAEQYGRYAKARLALGLLAAALLVIGCVIAAQGGFGG